MMLLLTDISWVTGNNDHAVNRNRSYGTGVSKLVQWRQFGETVPEIRQLRTMTDMKHKPSGVPLSIACN